MRAAVVGALKSGMFGSFARMQLHQHLSGSTLLSTYAVHKSIPKSWFGKFQRKLTTENSQRNYSSTAAGPSKKYSVGVVGAGRIMGVHLPNILKNRELDLKWIIEDNPENIQKVKDKYFLHDLPFFNSSHSQELLRDQSLDAMFVFSPTATHADYVCSGLKNGKAVFVEKPTAELSSDAKTCYELAEKHGKPLVTGFLRRFDAGFISVHDKMKDGALGKIHSIKLTSRDSPKPSYEFLSAADSSGCNILTDMLIHDIDLITWLTDSERPELLYVVGHMHDPVMQEIGEADAVQMVLKYPSGIITAIDGDRDSSYGYDIRLEVFGSNGVGFADNPDPVGMTIQQTSGGYTQPLPYSFPQRFGKAFENILQHFVECIKGTDVPRIKKEEVILTAEIVEKGLESYKESKVVFFDNI